MKTKKQFTNRILSLVLALVMVLGMLPISSLTMYAAENTSTAPTINLYVNGLQVTDSQGSTDGLTTSEPTVGWSYDPSTSTLTLTNAVITKGGGSYGAAIYWTGGDLAIELVGANTVDVDVDFDFPIFYKADTNDRALTIKGPGQLNVNGGIYHEYSTGEGKIAIVDGAVIKTTEISGLGDVIISDSTVIADGSGWAGIYSEADITITNSYVVAKSDDGSGIQYRGTLTITGSQVETIGSRSDLAGDKRDFTNSIVTTSTGTVVYGTATLKEELTIASGETINFETGASLTNADKLTVDPGAIIKVNGTEHIHNTDGETTYSYIDDSKHTKRVYCQDCPMGYAAETNEGHSGGEASCMSLAVCEKCEQEYGSKTSHILEYSSNGNTITETCKYNCGHTATAMLEAANTSYTGSAITTGASVTYSDGWAGSQEYGEITYSNNLNAGTATAKVMVEGKELTATFEINEADISGAAVTLNPTSGTYTGTAYNPSVSVTLDGFGTLVEGTDYTLSWNKTDFINADNYIATITGKGNFTGTKTAIFTIDPIELDETNTVVRLDRDTFVYDGTEHKPAVTVTFHGATLTEGVDYRVFYSRPRKVVNGKIDKWFGDHTTSMECVNAHDDYYAVVVGLGNFRTKDAITLYANFVIEKATVTEPTIASKTYNNTAQTADVPASDLYTVEENNGGTAKGEYDVVLKLTDAANYKWSTTESAEVTLKFVISAAQNSWTTDPSISGWTYGEAAKTPVGTAKYGTVKVVYTGKEGDGTDYNSETAPTKAGNYTATFTVEGTADYSGLSKQVNFTIAKKAVTVTANDASKTYGDSDPALTYTHTELVGSDALDITVSRASGENANTYIITASQEDSANPNYEITFKTGTFTIHKAPLTITAEDKTATYGDAVPTYTVKYDGFVNGDDQDELGGALAFYQTYNRFDDVGEYEIMPHGLTSDNYVIFYNFGKLTVSPKAITVTIENVSSPYGEALTELKATDNGIVNNDKDVYSLATTATGTSNVGKYAITGTALDSNYDVTFVNGEYEITKREITITVDAKNTVVNTTLPTYTYKVEGLVGVDTLVTEPTLTCNANIAVVGEYDITATGADAGGNYSIKYVPAKLTVLTDNAVDAAAGYTEELKDYDPATVTSEDKAELDEMLSEINTILADETTTDNGKKALEEVKEQVEKLIKEITDAAEAIDTENTVKVENVTPENVTPENKTDLEGAKVDLEKALEDNGGNYTEDEKKAIEDELGRIDEALEVIGNVEAVEEGISKLPAVDTVKPDDEETIKAITDAQTAYNALSDYEKSLVDEAAKANLDKLVAALVAYDIVEGDGSSWTEDSDHSITFVVNGLFSKFVGIKVDGKDVDKANYEVKAGSTIITLKASYLDTLAVGEHTISVVYTDGSTDGTFNVHAKANSPATGDDFNIALYGSLMVVSVTALVVLLLASKKRKQAK